MVAKKLRTLGNFSGTALVDAIFPLLIAEFLDPEEAEDNREERHVLLGRYGRQSMLQWDDVEVNRIKRYIRRLSRVIAQESGPDADSEG